MSQLALGCMLMGTSTNEPDSFTILDCYVAAGGTFLDTADCYAWWPRPGYIGGESESLLGRWLARSGRRDEVILAAKKGIAFEPLDNGFASCADPKRLQRVCDGLTDAKIEKFVRKWLSILPHPYTAADRRAGFRYALSILQSEFSLTQVLDRPVVGRVFFDDVIHHNLDLGRPDRVGLISTAR